MNQQTPQHLKEWTRHNTQFDRVISVVITASKPRTIEWISNNAVVTEEEAEQHLEKLTELGVIIQQDNKYYPDPLYLCSQRIRQFYNQYETLQALQEQKQQLQQQTENYQKQYTEHDNPQELFEKAQNTDNTQQKQTLVKDANKWLTAETDFQIIQQAIELHDQYADPLL